jgi:hypothetical protein
MNNKIKNRINLKKEKKRVNQATRTNPLNLSYDLKLTTY